jgi:hypothetical protein
LALDWLAAFIFPVPVVIPFSILTLLGRLAFVDAWADVAVGCAAWSRLHLCKHVAARQQQRAGASQDRFLHGKLLWLKRLFNRCLIKGFRNEQETAIKPMRAPKVRSAAA